MPDEAQPQQRAAVVEPHEAGDGVDWRALIVAADGERPEPVTAETFYRRWATASGAVELGAADANRYVVKGLRNDQQQNRIQGHMMFNDQVAGRLGALLGAPVPGVALVHVPAELVAANQDSNSQMGHMVPCVAHGSLVIPDVTERVDRFEHADENRSRFASLAIFFGWLHAGDPQFIFKKSPPCLVYSHDHGHFFPGGPNWVAANLNQAAPARAMPGLANHFNFRPEELAGPSANLRNATPRRIAEALAIPPDEWGVTLDDRVALAEYLWSRRAELIAAYPAA